MDYVINVTEIEELQTVKNLQALDIIFDRAYRTVNGGGTVELVRKKKGSKAEKFDKITTEEDLAAYKEGVYKYL